MPISILHLSVTVTYSGYGRMMRSRRGYALLIKWSGNSDKKELKIQFELITYKKLLSNTWGRLLLFIDWSGNSDKILLREPKTVTLCYLSFIHLNFVEN